MNCFDRGIILRTMKLTLFFILCFNLAIHASGFGQKVNLDIKNEPLERVFEQINKQTEYRFLYANDVLSQYARPVSLKVKNGDLKPVLDQIFKDQDLEYEIISGTINVTRKVRVTSEGDGIEASQPTPVQGIVSDQAGEAIAGVSVTVKGTTRGISTDENGRFSLNVQEGEILTFSSLGYETQEMVYGGEQSLDIRLATDLTAMDEVVVVAFGTQKKVNLTGSVATVDSKTLESRPVATVGQALQGVVPGLNLNVPSLGGELGQTMGINIRGAGTIGTGSTASPLILIDGIEGNMNNLNPDDIESISILKDASSAAIYGSRAAFGVILITTKSGKAGSMRIDYNNNFRYSGPTNLPNQLDSWRFANYFNEASANQGTSPVFNDETLERIQQYMNGEITTTTVQNGQQWNFHQQANDNVNWWETHFGWSWSNDHRIAVTGGSDKIQYYTSANYLNQNGNLNYGDDKYKRFNGTAKINAEISDFIDLNINTRFVRWTLDNPLYTDNGGLLYHDIARIWPMMPFKDPNGYYMRNGKLIQLTDGGRAVTSNDNLYGLAELIIRPTENWNIHINGGIRTINQHKKSNLNPIFEHNYLGEPLALPFSGSYAAGASFAGTQYSSSNHYSTSIHSDYTLEHDGHFLKGTLGMNTEEFVAQGLGARRSDLITPIVPEISAATGEDVITNSSLYDWATAGFFARANYVFQDRFLLEGNIRYDGSSRFLQDQRWTVLPSFSLGWNVANEAFFEPLSSTVSVLKPRVSWGKLGNQNTNDLYPFYLIQNVAANAGNWLHGGSRPSIAYVPGMISSYLTWEKMVNTNFGIDIGMFRNRLTLNYDYFIRITDDMVGPPAEVGAALGIALPNTNNAKLSNKGWELNASWQDKIGEFQYDIAFNLSDNRVKVESYPNESMSLSTYYDGMELGNIWGYTTQGIATTQDMMDEWLSHTDQSRLGNNWEAGDVMYRDLNGDGKVDAGSNTLEDHGDLTIIGNSNPRYRFGLSLGGAWKGLDFRIFLQGVMKRDVWLSDPMFWGITNNMWQAVGFEEHLDYFRAADTESIFGPNTDAYYPRPYMGGKSNKNHMTQTRFLQDASYIRLKNIQLGYTLPTSLSSRMKLNRVRIFCSAENLFSLSNIADMYDPEVIGGPWGAGKSYPLSSTFSFGINLSL